MVEKRVYQVWKGSNKFFLSGRLIFGPDVRSLLVTMVLIIVPAVIFYVFVARHLIDRLSSDGAGIAVLVVSVGFTIHVLILLLLTSGRDPGIIPRSPHPPEPEEYYDPATSPAEWSGGQRLRLPRTKDVLVNGIQVKVKYCDTCMLYRPPRCSHCSICNNCVERFDHHCPWVGQCIGLRNYRYFFMFVLSTTLLCIYVFTFCVLYIKLLMEGDLGTVGVKKPRTVWEAMGKSPASVVLMIYTFVAVWFVGGLTVFHLYLISTNQTTYENFRYQYDSRVNPYNMGLLRNFTQVFCSRIEPSKNNFRANVQIDASGRIIMSPDLVLPAMAVIDPGLGGKSTRRAGESDGNEAAQKRDSVVSDAIVEVKENSDDGFAQPIGLPLSSEGNTTGAHLRSSRDRKSGSWEMMPEILATRAGHPEPEQLNGVNTPRRGRVRENVQDADS